MCPVPREPELGSGPAFGADLALDPADPICATRVKEATRGRGLSYAFDFAGGRVEFSRSVSGALHLADAAEAVRRLDAKEGDPIRLVLVP
ncbi:hypothetical protein SAMN05421748_12440 [Paractinoplanes atraurantiacus]|uniref:Uncharacterized protein n=1 Tax=Paractinoplanes atraurantiacus TaxID=1036182 RepID=A0A285JRD8_9ACTN|nr:hypothetical protein SAMN05421748_12440 [Actinoplanes atraurantiacus]